MLRAIEIKSEGLLTVQAYVLAVGGLLPLAVSALHDVVPGVGYDVIWLEMEPMSDIERIIARTAHCGTGRPTVLLGLGRGDGSEGHDDDGSEPHCCCWNRGWFQKTGIVFEVRLSRFGVKE